MSHTVARAASLQRNEKTCPHYTHNTGCLSVNTKCTKNCHKKTDCLHTTSAYAEVFRLLCTVHPVSVSTQQDHHNKRTRMIVYSSVCTVSPSLDITAPRMCGCLSHGEGAEMYKRACMVNGTTRDYMAQQVYSRSASATFSIFSTLINYYIAHTHLHSEQATHNFKSSADHKLSF